MLNARSVSVQRRVVSEHSRTFLDFTAVGAWLDGGAVGGWDLPQSMYQHRLHLKERSGLDEAEVILSTGVTLE